MKSQLSFRPALLAAAAIVLSTSLAHAAGTPSNHAIGVNLNGFDYYSPDFPTIDQFKRAGGWYAQCDSGKGNCSGFSAGASGWDTLEESKLKLDENGWPTSLPAANDTSVKYRYVSALLFQDDGRVHPAGKYVVVYAGKGSVTYGLAGTKDAAASKPNRDVVDVRNSDSSGLLISIKETDPNDHVRDIRVYPPGGVCSGDKSVYGASDADCTAKGLGTMIAFENLQGRTWHPNFVNDLKGFRTLRFLDWNRTNSSTLENWEDRPRWASAMWTGPAGVPVNALVSLANEVGADPWINLPTHATDDYAMRFARQLKGILASGLNMTLEYGNEPWNGGFPFFEYLRNKAGAQWPDQVKKGVSTFELAYSWYGMRSAQLCEIVKKEFGADANRVKCVLNGQASNSWVSQQQLNCKYASVEMGGKTCAEKIDALAVAPYFGEYIGDMSVRSTVKTWYTQPDGGVSKVFEEILAQDATGKKVTPPLYGKTKESFADGALARAKSWMQSNKNEAAAHNLPLMGYEGGQHLVMAPGDTDQKWLDLMTAANRDARMGTAYTRTLNDWQAVGGQAYALFNHVYRPSKYGVWGLKESQPEVANYKWQAVLPYRDSKQCWWANCTR